MNSKQAWLLPVEIFFLIGVLANAAQAQQRNKSYPPKMDGAEEHVYRSVDGVDLKAWVFQPEEHKPSDERAVVVFFFGGGWNAGTPGQFEQHCRYLAARGMVGITVDYRVASRHQTKAKDCVSDAKAALRWVKTEAETLGIDPKRVIAAGGSAGGHLAACCGLVEGLEKNVDETAEDSKPSAMILFNPAVVLAPVAGEPSERLTAKKLLELEERMGVKPEKLSPYHYLPKRTGPCLIFHGKEDQTVPYRSVELFEKAMTEAGNEVKLVGFAGKGHGFFNYGREGNEAFRKTLREMDSFLVALDYLGKEPSSKAQQFLE